MIVLGHADMVSQDVLHNLKDYSNLKIAQWFLDPLNKYGPDYYKNKKRITDKSEINRCFFFNNISRYLIFYQNSNELFYSKSK